jgi:hypothetical protein
VSLIVASVVSSGTSLPAKGLARILIVVAFAGSALSMSVHLLILFGHYSEFLFHLQTCLFIVLFPIAIFAVSAQERLRSEFSTAEKMSFGFGGKIFRGILAPTPKWLRWASATLFLYALLSFAVLAVVTPQSQFGDQLNFLRLLSAYFTAFFFGAATLLTAYVRSNGPLRRSEIFKE